MKKVCLLLGFSLYALSMAGQNIADQLSNSINKLEKDSQMQAAIISFYVVDSKTGTVVYEKNSRYGMAAASTQKLCTSAAVLELLGQGYRYNTNIDFYRQPDKAGGSGIIEIRGAGDPSLGSWRFPGTKKELLLHQWGQIINGLDRDLQGMPAFKWKNIFVKDVLRGDPPTIPDGYIWQDIGNYYGAGTSLLNWNENQYDIIFRSGTTGSPVSIVSIDSSDERLKFHFSVTAGATGSGDNTYIYAAPLSHEARVRGTVPPNQKRFAISGSLPDPGYSLASSIAKSIRRPGDVTIPAIYSSQDTILPDHIKKDLILLKTITHTSPPLDSLVFWFLRKSINLYGEAFVKTVALAKENTYNLDKGLEVIKDFWQSNGVRAADLQITDGSGLSPQNRVTSRALVQVLQYSRNRQWFPAFFDAIPEFNGMKMKSGSITGARSFAGYHTSHNGSTYTFAIIINNYSGAASDAVKKMYNVLDLLK